MTVGELLSLENLGRSTLLEIMCVTEAAVDSGFLTAIEGTVDIGMRPPIDTIPQSETAVVSPPQSVEPVKSLDNWNNLISPFERLIGVAAELYRANTLADVLESDLGTLVSDLGLRSAFDHIEVDDLQSEPTIAHAALRAIDEFWRFLSPREKLIFKHRLATSKPLTLENLGTQLDVTRERVRQLQKLIESKWNHPSTAGSEAQWWLGALAIVIRDREGPITTRENLGQRLSAQFNSAVEVVGANTEIPEMAGHLLNKALGYTCMNGACLDQEAHMIVQDLTATARAIADDVGLIDEHELKNHLAAESWLCYWEELVRQCGLHRFIGHLAIRDTKKARVKAALIKIGRPATREELSERAGTKLSRVGSYLSGIPGVVRADKVRWGLDEWVKDEYEGIPAEIVQRIEEDAGATRVERLVEEIPRLFGVSENSVRAFCNAAMFVVDDGWIRLRDDREPYSYKNPDVACARGVFALGDRRVGLLYEVDHDVLRGSGRHLPHAAAAILRVRVNDRLHFAGPANTGVTITFPGTAHQGPSLGSSRALAEAASATCGDMMAVVLDAGEMAVSVTVTDINEYTPSWALIARLTGINEQSGIEGLAGTLKCSTGEVRATLRNRGDLVVLGAMPPRRLSPDLDDALAKLQAEVHRGATL